MDPNTFTVDGQQVAVRAAIPLKSAPRLPNLIVRFAESKNGDDMVAVLTRVLASWGYEGSPTDAKAYQDLDLFEEILPMGEKAIRVLNARLEHGRSLTAVGAEPHEIGLDGRAFTVKRRIPLSLAPRLPSMIDLYAASGDANDLAKLLATVAESSDLVDDPNDPRAYQDLELFAEVLPLGERVITYLNQKLEFARGKR